MLSIDFKIIKLLIVVSCTERALMAARTVMSTLLLAPSVIIALLSRSGFGIISSFAIQQTRLSLGRESESIRAGSPTGPWDKQMPRIGGFELETIEAE